MGSKLSFIGDILYQDPFSARGKTFFLPIFTKKVKISFRFLLHPGYFHDSCVKG